MTDIVERPADGEYAPFYASYVASIPEGELLAALASQLVEGGLLLREAHPDAASALASAT